MQSFRYKAVDMDGRKQMGRMEAVNESDLELRLSRMGLDLVSVREFRRGGPLLGEPGIRRSELITFCYHLEQLMRAGVPILEGLADLRDTIENTRFRQVIGAVIEGVEGGQALSASMADFPDVFDEVFCNLIRAGEQSGKLVEVLDNIVQSLKWQDELAAQTKKLFIYPAFVGTVVLIATVFVLVQVVPQLVSFLENMGQTLPVHTRLLIWVSQIFTSYWYVFILGPALLYAAVKSLARRSAEFRFRLDGLKLRLWFLGPVLQKITLTRFANYFSLLYASGVTVISSLEIIEKIVSNAVMRQALIDIRHHINEGKSISASIESVGLFPPLIIRMVKVGESTGNLDAALDNVSYFYNREVKESIERLQIIIEPAMTVLLGLVLGWVVLAVWPPIYDVLSKIVK